MGGAKSYEHAPMPRMTNTYMQAGDSDPADILAGAERWHLCRGLRRRTGGHHKWQIRVFLHRGVSRAKRQGRRPPSRAPTLIGDGATALTKIRGVGNDLQLDPGIGTCGKAGQWVPVGVGQPTLMIGGLTVGGSAA